MVGHLCRRLAQCVQPCPRRGKCEEYPSGFRHKVSGFSIQVYHVSVFMMATSLQPCLIWLSPFFFHSSTWRLAFFLLVLWFAVYFPLILLCSCTSFYISNKPRTFRRVSLKFMSVICIPLFASFETIGDLPPSNSRKNNVRSVECTRWLIFRCARNSPEKLKYWLFSCVQLCAVCVLFSFVRVA